MTFLENTNTAAVGKIVAEGKWIAFTVEQPISGLHPKTRRFVVHNKDQHAALGIVKWYPPFRAYAFGPVTLSVYEKQCLRDIAEFCERATIEYKARPISA